jgi:hypothetical protein
MKDIPLIPATFALILFVIFIVKTIHFFVCVNRKKFRYWLYFNHSSIVNSSSRQSKKTKQVQNFLSVLLLIFFLLALLVIITGKTI